MNCRAVKTIQPALKKLISNSALFTRCLVLNKISKKIWVITSIKWGSEYRTSPVFEWLRPVRSSNGPLFRPPSKYKIARYSDAVWIPNCYWASEYRTPKCLLFKWFCYWNVWYSDPHCKFNCNFNISNVILLHSTYYY